jgi:hypothetical protein
MQKGSRQLTALQHDGIRLVVGHDAVHDGTEQALVRLVIHAVLLHDMLHYMLVTECAGHPAVQGIRMHIDRRIACEHSKLLCMHKVATSACGQCIQVNSIGK